MKNYEHIHPIFIIGNWDGGFALDKHTISSELIGHNEYGREIFDTVRTEIGQLTYELKYRNNQENVDKIIKIARPFLDDWVVMKKINLIIPAPPTKKDREFQPVFRIARAIAKEYNIPIKTYALEKTGTIELKKTASGPKQINGDIICRYKADREQNILIIDDLFSTGQTLNECIKVLRRDPLINKIYILTMTKTR